MTDDPVELIIKEAPPMELFWHVNCWRVKMTEVEE